MGTRSLTHIIQKWNEKESTTLATIYRQWDGYPEGVGMDWAEFLKSGRVVNGISFGEKNRVFNGAGCLAAQLIAEFKVGAGGLYLMAPKSRNHGEEYMYKIIVDESTKTIVLECYEVGYIGANDKYVSKTRKLFSGSPEDFVTFVEKKQAEEAKS